MDELLDQLLRNKAAVKKLTDAFADGILERMGSRTPALPGTSGDYSPSSSSSGGTPHAVTVDPEQGTRSPRSIGEIHSKSADMYYQPTGSPIEAEMASGWTAEEFTLVRQTFDLFDSEGSATISWAEIKAALSQFGVNLTDAELTNLISEFDEDGDEEIDFTEFVHMVLSLGIENLSRTGQLDPAKMSNYACDTIGRWLKDDLVGGSLDGDPLGTTL